MMKNQMKQLQFKTEMHDMMLKNRTEKSEEFNGEDTLSPSEINL